MGRKRLFDRVRSWFGSKVEGGRATIPAAKRCALEPVTTDALTAFERTGAATVATAAAAPVSEPRDLLPGDSAFEVPSPAALTLPRAGELAATRPTTQSHLDPLDPPWIEALEQLPGRIAMSVTEAAGSARALNQVAAELSGHRQTSRVVMDAVRRLPDLAANQSELTRDTNRALERQTLLLESLFDGITALRASFRTVEESSRRHIMALAQLEACHRQVLFEYQRMLVKAHRRVAWLALTGVALAALAIGGLGYVALRVFVP